LFSNSETYRVCHSSRVLAQTLRQQSEGNSAFSSIAVENAPFPAEAATLTGRKTTEIEFTRSTPKSFMAKIGEIVNAICPIIAKAIPQNEEFRASKCDDSHARARP
jgi:hypothetical protein